MNNTLTYEQFLALFPDKPRARAGNGWLVLCPAHNDHTPSLWVRPSENPAFVATWDCQAGSCSREKVLAALHLTWTNVRRNGHSMGGDTTLGKACYSDTVTRKSAKSDSKNDGGTVTPPPLRSDTGVTVQAMADAKHLPAVFLKSLGVVDFKYCGVPAIKIPYYSEDGTELAVRYRLALSGDNRFRWRKGDRPPLYGLNHLEQIRKCGWALIVEGESDCWTGWYHGLPALGVPGKSTFRQEWGEYLQNLNVFVWQEPEAEDFTLRILKSCPDLKYIPAPAGVKDISEAHIQGKDVPSYLEALKARAASGRELKAQYDNEQLRLAYDAAKVIIEDGDPLALINEAIGKSGYGGDLKPVLITYLSATSRLLGMRTGAMPVHLLIMGEPSSGKSYTITVVLALLPVEAYHIIEAGSPHVLIYDDSDLQHRVLVFGEADSLPAGEDNPAASAIRNLLQDHHLHYSVTIRDPQTGDFVIREIDKPGPTVLLTTSVKSLGSQLMSRLFSLEMPDSKAQIVSALDTQAKVEINGVSPPDKSLVAFQTYLQYKAPWSVVVPFAVALSDAIGRTAAAARILRDYQRLLSLIKTLTIIRHKHRETDSQGRLISTIDDYQTIRELVNEMYVETTTGISGEIRNLVAAVSQLNNTRIEGDKISLTKLSEYLGITKIAASRRAKKAVKQHWIINREERKGYPADYIPGEPMPEVEGLPDLNAASPYQTVTDGVIRSNESKNGNRNTVSPVTDGDASPLRDSPEDAEPPPPHQVYAAHLRVCSNCNGRLTMQRLISEVPARWECTECGTVQDF